MPGRQSTGPPTVRASRNKRKPKRALDAFAIAQYEVPDNPWVRSGRLGRLEPDSVKRRRNDSEEEEEYQRDIPRSKRLRPGNIDQQGNEIEGGSDSEGNEWVTGVVGSDDDSSLDSDEAMGASDEERFAGWTFHSSSSRKGQTKMPSRKRMTADEADLSGEGVDLDEGSDHDHGSDKESEDFAANAVDLATAFDQDSYDEPERGLTKVGTRDDGSSDLDSDMGESGFDSDHQSELSTSDVDGLQEDDSRFSALQTFISSMDNGGRAKNSRAPFDLAQDATAPSEYGLTAKQKLSVSDLLATVTDPTLRKSLKMMQDDGRKSALTSKGIPGKLSAPLPKRQQDRIDRATAFEKSKETLNRWIDTVKHNRRAEHLVFPLTDPDADAAKNTKRLVPTFQSRPVTDLEATIQTILAESGLSANGKSHEQQIQEMEELATNKMPVEEVRARRVELRRARELLFREEIRAKRIKKIKSKSYRKVHRKDRERNALREKEYLEANGLVDLEEEQEKFDRRRAEERMGQRHRESRWAKAIKETGRAAWDEDARGGVIDMVRREEELRRRMQGKDAEVDDLGLLESESSLDEDSEEDDDAFTSKMRRKIKDLNEVAQESQSKLSSMKFMKQAEAARKAENDEALEKLQRELNSEESQEQSEDEGFAGRRRFGPQKNVELQRVIKEPLREFEERIDSDADDQVNLNQDDEPEDAEIIVDSLQSDGPKLKLIHSKTNVQKSRPQVSKQEVEEHPWLSTSRKSTRNKSIIESSTTVDVFQEPPSPKAVPVQAPEHPTIQLNKNTKNGVDSSDEAASEASFEGFSSPPPNVLTNRESLVHRAFAADDALIEESFAAEKAALATEEEPSAPVSTALPGWGSWVGPGLSRKNKRQPKKAPTANGLASNLKLVKKDEGIAPEKRKDRNLDRVIISEKRVPKSAKYLASSLPHPFESRAQYERSLRLPMGPEFTTKETFQGMTKPRVIKKGGVIAPMRKPLM